MRTHLFSEDAGQSLEHLHCVTARYVSLEATDVREEEGGSAAEEEEGEGRGVGDGLQG